MARRAARARGAGGAARCAGRSTSAAATAARRSRRSARSRSRPTRPSSRRTTSSRVLGHLLAAGSLHRLQDRTRRDEQLQRALDLRARAAPRRGRPKRARACSPPSGRSTTAMRARALELLAELPPGVARRTQALRLKLQAARLGAPAAGSAEDRAPARQAPGLLARSPRTACCARWRSRRSTRAHDIDQLRRVWLQLRRRRPARPVRRRARRDARGRARRARGSARLAAAVLGAPRRARATTSAPRSRCARRARCDGHRRRLAAAARSGGAAPSARRRARARGRHRARRAPALGQGAAAARAGRGRRRRSTRRARRQAWRDAGAHRRRGGRRRARAAHCYRAAARAGLRPARKSLLYCAALRGCSSVG